MNPKLEKVLIVFSIVLIVYNVGFGEFSIHPGAKLKIKDDENNGPKMLKTDIIYTNKRETPPIVNEEYKVIFFHVAKAASSEWIRFFTRLNGNPAWCGPDIHNNTVNNIKRLNDYTLKEAERMMKDPTWTKAIFVRNPKTRLLSAYLDKVLSHPKHFKEAYCHSYMKNGGILEDCWENYLNFDFFIHNITTISWKNVHWRPIITRIDEKWWPYINYIRNMENLSHDAKDFLQHLKSSKDGISAWDRIGRIGWSDNERDCNTMGTKSFLQKKDHKHAQNAGDKLKQHYTPELEKFVEQQYWKDYHNPYFKFSPLKIFDNETKEANTSNEIE